jgi:hypothetical protein
MSCFGHSYFGHSNSCPPQAGEFRVSVFGFRISAELALEIMPSWLRPKPGPLDPDFY